MQHGWSSHLSIWDNAAASVEHKVDIFSNAPRVKPEEIQTDNDGWASQHLVAQMKKTDRPRDCTTGEIERLLLLERLVWERVNYERHSRYASAWKSFYRRWWNEKEWEWPISEPFWMQHKRVLKAVREHQLPPNPLADISKSELIQSALIGWRK